MKSLSLDSMKRAELFMHTQARPLDLAVYNYLFKGSPQEHALMELGKFQNDDGGFGQGIEIDFRLPLSSPMSTSIGLQYLIRLNVSVDHDMFARAIDYLVNEYDAVHEGWWANPESLLAYPHAPWWGYNAQHKEEYFQKYWLNPCIELIGYLSLKTDAVSGQLFQRMVEKAMKMFDESNEPLDGHAFLCCVRAIAVLPQPYKDTVYQKVCGRAVHAVQTDSKEWDHYCITPHQCIENKKSLLYPIFESCFDANLDWLIDSQQEDGSWHPRWSWGQYESDWNLAKKEWQGKLTLLNMIVLKNFHRIADD